MDGGHDSFLGFLLLFKKGRRGGGGEGDCGLEMQFKRGPARYSLLPALQSEYMRNKKAQEDSLATRGARGLSLQGLFCTGKYSEPTDSTGEEFSITQ